MWPLLCDSVAVSANVVTSANHLAKNPGFDATSRFAFLANNGKSLPKTIAEDKAGTKEICGNATIKKNAKESKLSR